MPREVPNPQHSNRHSQDQTKNRMTRCEMVAAVAGGSSASFSLYTLSILTLLPTLPRSSPSFVRQAVGVNTWLWRPFHFSTTTFLRSCSRDSLLCSQVVVQGSSKILQLKGCHLSATVLRKTLRFSDKTAVQISALCLLKVEFNGVPLDNRPQLPSVQAELIMLSLPAIIGQAIEPLAQLMETAYWQIRSWQFGVAMELEDALFALTREVSIGFLWIMKLAIQELSPLFQCDSTHVCTYCMITIKSSFLQAKSLQVLGRFKGKSTLTDCIVLLLALLNKTRY